MSFSKPQFSNTFFIRHKKRFDFYTSINIESTKKIIEHIFDLFIKCMAKQYFHMKLPITMSLVQKFPHARQVHKKCGSTSIWLQTTSMLVAKIIFCAILYVNNLLGWLISFSTVYLYTSSNF